MHVLLWLVHAPDQLSTAVRDAVADPSNAVLVSAASAWGIATKASLGKLTFDAVFLNDSDRRIHALGFEVLAVTSLHAVTGAQLPGSHGIHSTASWPGKPSRRTC